jgi:hypothetical protein
MALDVKRLNEAQKDLDKRSGGNKNWIQLSKIEEPIDVKIMDPLPAMNGIYYIEVPVWWIDGTRIISPKIYGPAEFDIVESAINEAKTSKDKDILALLNAKDANGNLKVQKKNEYWVPGLKFNWKFDTQQQIVGIWDSNGALDVELIDKFIEDNKWKIISMGIMALRAINKIATARGGYKMPNQLDGFNITLSKTGEKKKTVYSAVKADDFPMPAKYYDVDKMIDPFEVAESLMFTDDYMNMVIGKYLYGEECPEKPGDEHYANPEIREKLKNRLSEESEETEVKSTARQRPGRGAAPVVAAAEPAATKGFGRRGAAPAKEVVVPAAAPAAAPVDDKAARIAAAKKLLEEAEAEAGMAQGGTDDEGDEGTVPAAPVRGRTRPGAAPAAPVTTAAPVTRQRGGRRNLSQDIQNVE